jgi:hypothetical protein
VCKHTVLQSDLKQLLSHLRVENGGECWRNPTHRDRGDREKES